MPLLRAINRSTAISPLFELTWPVERKRGYPGALFFRFETWNVAAGDACYHAMEMF